jgi:hypothetical protein
MVCRNAGTVKSTYNNNQNIDYDKSKRVFKSTQNDRG